MQVSSARLNTVRVALVVFIINALFLGVMGVFLPNAFFEMMASKEAFSSLIQGLLMGMGAFALTWAVAAAIALRDPLKNRGLIQAIVAGGAIGSIIFLYTDVSIVANAPAAAFVGDSLPIIVAVVIAVAYPWGQTTT